MSNDGSCKIYTSIGLMSGTSMDGIDLALIKSDGKNLISREKFSYFPYSAEMKKDLQFLINGTPNLREIKIIERNFTMLNAEFINNFLQEHKISVSEIDIISFHGHTIYHAPEHNITWQIGDAASNSA